VTPQVPSPVHTRGSVATSPLHFPVAQTLVAAGYAHDVSVFPSHLPAHADVPPTQIGRSPCGTPETAEHVPSLPLLSHASHCPLHAESQHTPSTQKDEMHSLEFVHFPPFSS
jgi:hypothetical protein